MAKPGILELRLRPRPVYAVMSFTTREWLCENGIHTAVSCVADDRGGEACTVCGAEWDGSGHRRRLPFFSVSDNG
jgi:hypothetical protein